MQKPHPKLHVALLFGGKSAEHEISVLSAVSIIAALDHIKFEPMLIGIDRMGGWHLVNTPEELKNVAPTSDGPNLRLLDGAQVIFPVLHGPMGEDGTMQGLLELIGLPYVGPNVLSSAVGMDKDVMKRLLEHAGIKIAPYVVVSSHERSKLNIKSIVQKLGLLLFVKPANMGSSIGVRKVTNEQELPDAIDYALRFDQKVLIESAINGHEIECAVLGNAEPKASVVGRIIPKGDVFYSYDAKYSTADGTVLEIPAKLPSAVTHKAQETALAVYKTLGCEGMSRVDMFATESGEIIVNEINTLPGFTQLSMYPQLWAASGVSYPELITCLLELAMERSEKRA